MEIWMTLLVSLFSSVVTAPGFAQLTHNLVRGSGIRVGILGRICGGSCQNPLAMRVLSDGFEGDAGIPCDSAAVPQSVT